MQIKQKHQQQIEELCGASIRALTGLADLRHRGKTLFLHGKRIGLGAPHLQTDPMQDDFRSHRGASDGIALRLQYSDESLHLSLCPDASVPRLIFDLLEQLRVESLVSGRFPGIKSNLLYRFRQWSLRFHQDNHTETQLGLLIYTIAQIAWSRLSGYPTLEETDDVIEATRTTISPVIGNELAGLRRDRHDQKAYAEHALLIAQIVDNTMRASTQENSAADSNRDDSDNFLSRITLALDFSDDAEDANIATIITGTSKVLSGEAGVYRVFTGQYDAEIKSSARVRVTELIEFRDRLDRLIHAQGINIPRLARQITDLLAVPGRDGWRFGEEEGLIDGRRLTQVISTPAERRIFRREQYRFKNDCLVSFLIDCSGSMKKYIDYIAMMVDIFGRALDQAEISSEILGFTTGDWNGGRAYQDWMSQGRPQNPGRLNERCHFIFKNADTGWRKARRDIAALLKTPNFREGLDGEAVDWACKRMRRHGEKRKILIVISDGSPMDSATNLANDEYYLDNHLKQVVEQYDAEPDIEIYGLGVGLSLTPYYSHSLAIDLGESLSNSVFQQILQMIAHAQRR
jgi:cobaltochelatase CobT